MSDGLGSYTQIHTGIYDFENWSYKISINEQDCTEIIRATVPQVAEMENQFRMLKENFDLRVEGGSIEREKDGRITAVLSFQGVTRNSLSAMKMIGIDRITFATDSQFVSTSSDQPTVFESEANFTFEKGAIVPSMFGGAVQIDTDVDGDVFVIAWLFKNGNEVQGRYSASADYFVKMPDGHAMKMELDFSGTATLQLLTDHQRNRL